MNNTLKYFKELSKIPRPSGKEEKVRDFLINFAKEHNLECFYDKTNNVIIKKPAKSKANKKTLILQAHTDMVCEKNNDVDFDFNTMGINLVENGDFLCADGTTLGADNGIGLSMILSILSNNSLNTPNLECVFTAQEETTMQGAIDLDFSKLNGEHLLSIDGTDEGKLEVSSAGMEVINLTKSFKAEKIFNNAKIYEIAISGLRGGHSGSEINTNRENAIKILFELLSSIKDDINLISVNGGGKSNAIPRECKCLIATKKNDILAQSNKQELLVKYLKNEDNIKINCEIVKDKVITSCLSALDSKDIIDFVCRQVNGVLVYSQSERNFPIVSNNFANIVLDKNQLNCVISLRSSVIELEKDYTNRLFDLAKEYGIDAKVVSSAPFFERNYNSYLQKVCKQTYMQLYNKPAVAEGVHAGLEGGVFAQKKKDLDICVIAPNIYDAHSPQERVSLSSINRVYDWLVEIVKNF